EESDESQQKPVVPGNRQVQARSSSDKIAQWLTPRSEHFPTPRGFHFLSAPILPESPSTASFDESNSPSTIASNAWNRQSVSTDVTEFDDIYDVSDDDGDDLRSKPARASSLKRVNSSRASTSRNVGAQSLASHRGLPQLVIPAQSEENVVNWPDRRDLKKLASPVPPTPPAKVEMSPAVMSYIQAQQAKDVPTISAPPSLDGSLSSDQMATMSAPPTPIIGAEECAHNADWSGVQLQPAALATLQALSGADEGDQESRPEQVIELPEGRIQEMSQQTPRAFTAIRPALRLSTEQQPQQSLNGLTRLSIPSPGGFFSGLSPRSRHTWHLPTMTPEDVAPPTSTTAEQFYRCPWNQSVPPMPTHSSLPPPPPRPEFFTNTLPTPPPMEQIVEVRETMSDGIPTARPAVLEQVVEAWDSAPEGPPTARRIEPSKTQVISPISAEPLSPKEAVAATEIVTVYDPEYAGKLRDEALSNLDRTELWLMAQKSYMKGVLPEEDGESEPELTPKSPEVPVKEEAKAKEESVSDALQLQKKKTVRFSEIVVKSDIPCSLPSMLLRKESAYYRAFQDHVIKSRSHDAFVHRLPRFEALQSQRVSLREIHRNQLLGKHQLSVVPQSAKKRMSANVARGDHILAEDDPDKIRCEKEAEARAQMALATWHVGALKALNGGRLFSAPIDKRLRRLSMRPSGTSSGGKDRARILDLGGQATCDWAWHCALAYPAAKVYTATTKAARQLSNSNIRGPPNHRQVAVARLSLLPFPDAHFDLVSARELHAALKFVGENGADEWEAALAECRRVLKPGGYLEFSVLDSDLLNAGPLGLAKSVEFGFALKTLGYDPQPTRLFLGRLQRAGFEGVRRAWTCLPVGCKRPKAGPPAVPSKGPTASSSSSSAPTTSTPTPTPSGNNGNTSGDTVELEAMVMGSTDAAAAITGLAGGWSWERWLLRAEMEKIASEGRLCPPAALGDLRLGTPQEMGEAGKCLEDVHDVIEEGRRCGAGFRVLRGFARKPVV
ncbi:hypothetical protein SLS62_011331, partial [Diatrype stigma]